MKIYFATYHHSANGLSGSTVYHHNLAKVMLGWGWEVRSLNLHVPRPFDCEGVQVCTMAQNLDNQLWCDVLVTHPGPHVLAKEVKRRRVIIKHNDTAEPYRFDNDKVIYCGQHAATAAPIQCFDSFVWNPGNRFYGTEKRGNPYGPWIMINCCENKGGRRLIELAEAMPETRFVGVIGAYGNQITKRLPNLEYWPGAEDIGQYFQKSAGLLCLSKHEGFPTGVMEAMSHGLPVVGNSQCGGLVDVCGDNNTGLSADVVGWKEAIGYLSGSFREGAVALSLARAKEIEDSRDFDGLKRFFTP